MAARDGLILKFSTDLLPAQKSIQDFALNSVSMLSSLGRKAVESQASLENYGKVASTVFLAGGALAGFEAFKLAFEAVSKAATAARQDIDRLVKIGDDAKSAAVGTTFFQQFTAGSKQMGLEAEDLMKILTTLQEKARASIGKLGDDDEGKPEAIKAIEAEIKAGNLSPQAKTAFTAASDVGKYGDRTGEEQLKVVLNLLDELLTKDKQLAAFDLGKKVFGDDFEAKMRRDAGLVDGLQQKLRAMANGKGVNAVPEDEIARARELKDEIDSLDQRIQNALVPFHNDLRRWQQEELQATITLKGYWADIVEVFAALWKWVDRIDKSLHAWGNADVFKDAAQWLRDHDLLFSDTKRDHAFYDKDGKPTTLEQAKKDGTEHVYFDADGKKQDDGDVPGPPLTVHNNRKDRSNKLPKDDEKEKRERQDPVEEYINSLKKETAAEEAKASTLGLSNQAQREALDLAKAREIATEHGRTLTDAETATVKAQADAYVAAEAKIKAFDKAQADAAQRTEFFGEQFEGAVEKIADGGAHLRDIMLDVVRALEQAALKAVLLGQGPLGGLFGLAAAPGATGAASVGGLFGKGVGLLGGAVGGGGDGGGLGGLAGLGKLFAGFFADGGTIPAGMFGIAGERGPEIIHGPSTVTPTAAIDRAMSGMGGSTTNSFTHAPTYNITPAGGVTVEQLGAVLDRHDKQLNRTIGHQLTEWQRRYG